MFAWRSTRSESQRHYSEVGVSSERREPNGVGRSRLAGCELRGRRVQQEECRSVRAVQCSAVQCRKTGQEGPVRGKSGDCPCWKGCALVVYGASKRDVESGRLSVCLSASEAYLWSSVGGERQTRRYLRPLPTNRSSTIESMGQSPHCPRSQTNRNTFSSYARSSDIMQECTGLSNAVWSLHMCAYATVWSLFEALWSTCCITLNVQ